MSDASGQGWGAHSGETRIQGRWSCSTQGVVSNILEMRTAFLALTLASQIRGQRILLHLDNMAAVAYLQKQGGTRSRSFLKVVMLITLWAEKNLLDPRAMYLPGRLNTEADTLPRNFLDNNEWAFHPPRLPSDCQHVGSPSGRPVRLPKEYQAGQILLSNAASTSRGSGCPVMPLKVHHSICLSSQAINIQIPPEAPQGVSPGGGSTSVLAEETLVPSSHAPQCELSNQDPSFPSTSVTGQSSSSKPSRS